jgi:hypothetical protein
VEKYSTVGQATGDNMVHAHCMLDNQGYKYKLRTCNIHCFSTATMAARMHLNGTFTYIARFVKCSRLDTKEKMLQINYSTWQ